LVPVEFKLYGDSLNQKEVAGFLEKEKGEGVFKKTVHLFSAYDKRWFICRSGHLAYMKDKDSPPINIVPLSDVVITNYGENFENWFYLATPYFNRALLAPNKHLRQMWAQAIRNNAPNTSHRFSSFAPPRDNQKVQWFVNGSEYFAYLLKVLPRAKHRIFISDWAFAPYLYLCRKHPLNPEYRLDNILKSLAKKGVEIYVLIWYASSLSFDLRPKWVVNYLNELWPGRIRCMTHPPWTPVIWSHHQKFLLIDESVAFVGGIDLCYNRYDDEEYLITDPNSFRYQGRDYNNLNYPGCGETNGETEGELIDRTSVPRMPWHDIHMVVEGSAANDVAFNFIQRWNHAARDNHAPVSYLILPESTDVLSSRKEILTSDEIRTTVTCQVVRSVGLWSAGQTVKETSIYRAYETLIRSARHFIFIENQYFITSINRAIPQNRIAKALYERIKSAITNKEKFRVIIILPVCPAGDLFAASTRYVMKYVYKAINRDQNRSLLTVLNEEFPNEDIGNYIMFHALRNYSFFTDPITGYSNPITEQIYVHSKLMIVDDMHVIIGSANINDRSLLGDRDSEICLVVSDTLENCTTMKWDGHDIQVGAFAHSLRMRLFREHLGIHQPNELLRFADPICDHTVHYWKVRSKSNTFNYCEVFPCIPSNSIPLLGPLRELISRGSYWGTYSNPNLSNDRKLELLGSIQGHLVDFPYEFLINENLSPQVGDAELVVPRVTFV
jgi:phospholipase D1/2